MLICTRCNTTRSGNRATYSRCECGGQFAVIRDGRDNGDFNSDGPKELIFGDDINKRFSKRASTLSPNRKVKEGFTEEGADYGESNVLEM